MTASYIAYHPEEQQLLPSALQDWLPQGHLAYFINDTIDSLDLKAFHARYAAGGPRNQPFHPAMMVKVMVYAYATGTFSSRKIAKKLFEDVAFRVLAADNFPAHRTIRDFRALHLGEFTELFVQVVRLAREIGLVKLGTIAVDGTKLKANASCHKAMSYGRMQSPPGGTPAPGGQPARARTGRLTPPQRQRRQAQRRQTLPARLGVPAPKAQDSFTDPESRMRGLKKANAEFKLVCLALNLRRMGAMQMT